jgi:hypothetical protein
MFINGLSLPIYRSRTYSACHPSRQWHGRFPLFFIGTFFGDDTVTSTAPTNPEVSHHLSMTIISHHHRRRRRRSFLFHRLAVAPSTSFFPFSLRYLSDLLVDLISTFLQR